MYISITVAYSGGNFYDKVTKEKAVYYLLKRKLYMAYKKKFVLGCHLIFRNRLLK